MRKEEEKKEISGDDVVFGASACKPLNVLCVCLSEREREAKSHFSAAGMRVLSHPHHDDRTRLDHYQQRSSRLKSDRTEWLLME